MILGGPEPTTTNSSQGMPCCPPGGFGVEGLVLRVESLQFRVKGKFQAWSVGYRIKGRGFDVGVRGG